MNSTFFFYRNLRRDIITSSLKEGTAMNRYTPAQKRAVEKYRSEKVERIEITVPNGRKAAYQEAAAAAGNQSGTVTGRISAPIRPETTAEKSPTVCFLRKMRQHSASETTADAMEISIIRSAFIP